MAPTITLLVTRGPLSGQSYAFTEPTTCVVGRAKECTISLPPELDHLDVSRRHCLLEIAPPSVRVCDLGSLNGTFVNGQKIGQRDSGAAVEETGRTDSPIVALSGGDEIQLGDHTAFRVCVSPSEASLADSIRDLRPQSVDARRDERTNW
jgi:eukaryotic-like serine/threonine-protein kinase